MKHLLFGSLGASGFATPIVNRHITFLFDAAVEHPIHQKFDGEIILWLFSLCLFAKSYFYIEVIGQHCHCFSICHVHHCMIWGKVSANHSSRSPGSQQLLARTVAVCHSWHRCVWSLLSGRQSISQLYKQKMLDLPWMPSLCTQTPAWHGRDACWKEMPRDLWKSAFLVLPGFYPVGSLVCMDPSVAPSLCPGWQCVSLSVLPTNIPVKPSRLWAKEGAPYPPAVTVRCALAALHQPPHSLHLFGTISVTKKKAALLHMGTGSLPGVMCQTPFIFPAQRFSRWQKPRWEAGEVRCSSPCPCWCGSLWWLISVSKCFKDTPFFSRILWGHGPMWDGKRDRNGPYVEERAGSAQRLTAESWQILPGEYLHTSVSIKGKLAF